MIFSFSVVEILHTNRSFIKNYLSRRGSNRSIRVRMSRRSVQLVSRSFGREVHFRRDKDCNISPRLIEWTRAIKFSSFDKAWPPVIEERRINQMRGTGGRKDNSLPHGRVIGFSWILGARLAASISLHFVPCSDSSRAFRDPRARSVPWASAVNSPVRWCAYIKERFCRCPSTYAQETRLYFVGLNTLLRPCMDTHNFHWPR